MITAKQNTPSYCCVMSHPMSDINLSAANFVLKRLEGLNVGIVSNEC